MHCERIIVILGLFHDELCCIEVVGARIETVIFGNNMPIDTNILFKRVLNTAPSGETYHTRNMRSSLSIYYPYESVRISLETVFIIFRCLHKIRIMSRWINRILHMLYVSNNAVFFFWAWVNAIQLQSYKEKVAEDSFACCA